MGYETRLYVGYFSNVGSKGEMVRLSDEFQGIPAGCIFNLWEDSEGKYFYLLDGNTRINLACAEKAGAVEVLPAADRQYFQTMVMLDLCKIGHFPLEKDAIICDCPEFFIGEMQVDQDRYGDKIVVYDPKAVLKALRASLEESPDYWRLKMAIQCLENIIENAWQSPLGVINFGY